MSRCIFAWRKRRFPGAGRQGPVKRACNLERQRQALLTRERMAAAPPTAWGEVVGDLTRWNTQRVQSRQRPAWIAADEASCC